ncbi:hypothetical protein SAMN05421788_1011226 [Filimonas lacunae]|uniref:Uncharacterized protein n=1 Tax=Filimonas lacunae TaxID=477680 RepID=A0A173MQ74_9BACT|nr:DUF6770 family protein [Filimonas lacunae]BAV09794.1 hypothetical protein FLA_5847 [Filimonas lacunae]SIS79048.1 hypothetical protein SAMN05421788_1011226 [Filimonas lacunae]
MKQTIIAAFFCMLAGIGLCQNKLSIDNVRSVYLRNSGTIKDGDQIKGYYLFYQSDKVDKKTNEYTLQILDQNLNKVKDVVFEDSKKVELLEASYNGEQLGFLFKNGDTKTLDMKIYDMTGKMMASFSNEIDKKAERRLALAYAVVNNDENTNKNMFGLKGQGFVTVFPVKEDGHFTYHLEFYLANRKQFSFTSEDEEKFSVASYLGSTDSLLLLEVIKKRPGLSSNIVAINLYTHKKQFEISTKGNENPFVPVNMTVQKGTGNLIIMGAYYEPDANIIKDNSQGIGVYVYSTEGKLVNKSQNSFTGELSKYFNVRSNGKIEDIGYLYFHDIIQAADGKVFAVAEGYKRVADALGIGLNVLSMGSRSGGGYAGYTKMKVTDLVMLELNTDYKIINAKIYEKNSNSYPTPYADYNSQHALALIMKADGAFDYEFTLSNADKSSFSVCYNDYERSKDFKGNVFHSIRYNGKSFSTDQINLGTKATSMKVQPAKQGYVTILEYYKKDKRIDLRMEKLN